MKPYATPIRLCQWDAGTAAAAVYQVGGRFVAVHYTRQRHFYRQRITAAQAEAFYRTSTGKDKLFNIIKGEEK